MGGPAGVCAVDPCRYWRARARRPSPTAQARAGGEPARRRVLGFDGHCRDPSALLQRATTGVGQHLDIAMGQVAVYVNEWAAVSLQEPVNAFGGFDTWNHFTYRLGDDTYVALAGKPSGLLAGVGADAGRQRRAACRSRFRNEESRTIHLDELIEVIDSLTGQFESFEALDAVLDPWTLAAQVRSVADLARTDWATQRGLTADALPGLPVPAAPWQATHATIGLRSEVAAMGAHNRSVLADFGYDENTIAALQRSGALREHAG